MLGNSDFDRITITNALREQGLYSEADKYKDCGRKGMVLKCSNSDCNYKGFIPFECDLRICPVCGRRFAERIFPKYQDIIKSKQSHPARAYSLKFITLTQANKGKTQDAEQFHVEIKGCNKNVRRFMNKLFPKSSGSGGLSVLEVGRNFNVHAHILVYGRYYPQAYLSEIWGKINHGESYVVDVRRVKGSAESAFRYLTKYIKKPCKFDNPIDYAVYLKALKGIRRVHSFGIFYGLAPVERNILMKCPDCGERLIFDSDFYFNIGKLETQFLKYSLGIYEVCFSQ